MRTDYDSAATPAGYGPPDIRSAYALPGGTAGTGQTVAIIDAYDLPTAEADLATYRERFGLPACTSADGCFRKVGQNGGTRYPAANAGWGQEIALDLDLVSAACPSCHILLVEANSNALNDLGTAVNRAATLGATQISNSYGAAESSAAPVFDAAYFDHPGIAITASSGDDGYGVQYPAASPLVTAVGGTSLTRATSARGWTETAWSGAGAGCAAYSTKPAWQRDAGCPRRTVSDVSAVADPNTGVAVYDSTPALGQSGWQVFGGTSVAAPLVAGIYALAGSAGSQDYPSSYPYATPGGLNDVVGGSDGTCTPAYLCTAIAGADGPTGLGTPNGVTSFAPAATPPPSAPPRAAPPSAAPATGVPVAVAATANGVEVVDRTTSGSVERTPWNSTTGWGATENLGGVAVSGPAAVATPDGTVTVLVHGKDNHLYAKTYTPASGWTRWTGLGGILTGRPSAAASGTDGLDVFVVSSDQAVWRRSSSPTGWSPWSRIGATAAAGTGPAAATTTDGQVTVALHGADGHLSRITCRPGAGCGSWTSLGGAVVGNPGIGISGGALRVYVRSTDGGGWVRNPDGPGPTTWQPLGGTLGTGPSAGSLPAGTRTDLFALDRGGALIRNVRSAGIWGGWGPAIPTRSAGTRA